MVILSSLSYQDYRVLQSVETDNSCLPLIVSGLAQSPIPTLLVQRDNRWGLCHGIAKAIGEAGINLSLLMVQVVGRKYSALFGFGNEADAV
jgi:hypothetical protein